MDYRGLPGADLIEEGLTDLGAGNMSCSALLVLIGAPRLRRLGVNVPDLPDIDAEKRLYLLLASQDQGAAHARYNALIRRLVSFERAAECVS